MIKEQDLLEAIAECQGQRNPTANTCIKLASYYTILEHLKEDGKKVDNVIAEVPAYSFAERPAGKIEYDSTTEFGQTIKGKDQDFVLGIMDELMATLQEMIPRLYNGVLSRLNE